MPADNDDGGDYLTVLGENPAPLRTTTGYDDVTGLAAATASFVTAFRAGLGRGKANGQQRQDLTAGY